MYKLVHTDEGAPDDTGYNDFPVGWRKISEEEFANLQSVVISLVEHRQMYDKSKKDWHMTRRVDGTLYWHSDNTGHSIVTDYVKMPNGVYGHVMEFYAFGCEHNYEHTANLGRCYNEYKCTKCGHVNTVDSSD